MERGRGGKETRRWREKVTAPENRNREEEDEDWETVRRKKGKGKLDEEPSMTIFLANLPERVSRMEVWLECRRVGNITDVYLPFKRDLMGKRFAFARFNKIRDLDKLIKALNNTWIGDRRINANVSKFEREEDKEGCRENRQYGRQWGKTMGHKGATTSGQNWATRPESDGRQDVAQKQPERQGRYHGGGRQGGGRSYLDAVLGDNQRKAEGLITLPEIDEECSQDWSKRTVSMEAKTVEVLCKAKTILCEVCPDTMEVRYIGGLRILVTMGSQMVDEELLTSHREKCEENFTDIKPWKDDKNWFQRLAWIRICGVPISLRNKAIFKAIGERLGMVVRDAEASMKDSDLTCAFLGIIVTTGQAINKEIEVRYKSELFKCWISEMSGNWAPNFVNDETVFINIPEAIPIDTDTNANMGSGRDEESENEKEATQAENNIGGTEIPATGEEGSEKTKGQGNERPDEFNEEEETANSFGGN
ncbi:uncharacterized protein LOC110932664 [Helianthus annuus]|uniref:uncharacterized protein LOC110932664 n=1 Tax=Helianthus annuus TaxID=4232 RepID=UPI000B8F48C6|nr:uncharacterized protein LOC110932664 [Helianthus annuus]